MTGAELKVQLTGLGLTPQWLADRLNVTKRTILRWFDLDEAPPEAVAEIERITAVTVAEMGRLIFTAGRSAAGGTAVVHTRRTEGVQELNTLPASWHRALTFRVLERVRAQGVKVSVGYSDPKAEGSGR